MDIKENKTQSKMEEIIYRLSDFSEKLEKNRTSLG